LVGVAVKVTDVPGQILLALGDTVTDGTGAGRTVIVTWLLTVAGEAQVAFEVRITFTTSLLFKVELLKVGLFVPTLLPFNCHWYEGVVPPFIGVAVNVTDVPGQILLALGEILTDGVTRSLTAMVIVLLVTDAEVGHTALDVITTVILSALTSELLVNVVPPVPTSTPLSFHW
jgi:hypothetical protein